MHRHGLLFGSLLVALLLAAVVGWTATPKAGGTLRVALPGDMTFFNANQGPAQGAPAAWLVHNMGHSAAACTPSHRK